MASSHQESAIWINKTYFLTFSVRKEKQIVVHFCRFGLFPVKQHHRLQAASAHQCGARVHPPTVIHHTNISDSWNTDKSTWIQQLLLQVGTLTLYILTLSPTAPWAPPCPMALGLIGPRKKEKKTGLDDVS